MQGCFAKRAFRVRRNADTDYHVMGYGYQYGPLFDSRTKFQFAVFKDGDMVTYFFKIR